MHGRMRSSGERMSAQIETTRRAGKWFADRGADSVSNFELVSRIEIPCYFDFPILYLII